MKVFKFFMVLVVALLFGKTNYAVQSSVVVSKNSSNLEVVTSTEEVSNLFDDLKITKKMSEQAPKVSKAVLIVLCFFLPFVAVGLKTDWGMPVIYNLLWCLLGGVPGIIHALYVVLK